ncbi:serine protease, S1-C subfamily, contains C-terminal PDZ domain [Microbulbifer donghaiensis]|uniref:Serine protease, S1-C subfamily, contains C-terminal PDZ domain n=1 Tax=Microbulbifer donghaiensis TaxID=494016 RepID=A0A1M4YKK9_9GAMM|nr:trypsin-like peptidase domain-containing protein [Microbulbifer donghaiensis]SHF06208.1 serine protease, S1-C subfamily, contains C-terminal PDZ domain [Microbulbifer donghaiensis]
MNKFKALLLAAPLLLLTSLANATTPVPVFATDDEQNTMQVFNFASPSVVYVTNETLVRDRWTLRLHTVPKGAGSGFIWDDLGHVVTNFHVIEGARKVTITLQDRSEWPAQLVGSAPEKDLAVLKIDAPPELLKPLEAGTSNNLAVGRKVLAIGNPFGLDTTLTTGVVSALGREIQAANNRTIRNVIQTDAAINPGNSGGPLLDSSGRLIGVNTAIYSPSGASVGIGFAIPVDTVKKIVPELIAHGRLVRPVLGIESAPDQWASQYGYEGVAVLRTAPGMPAERAGLRGIYRTRRGGWQLGDVIVEVDSQPVNTYDDLMNVLENHRAGDEVSLGVVRDGKRRQTSITLAAPE